MTRSAKTNMPILDTAALTSSAGQALYDRASMHLGIEPDVAVFAKCISNGYPMAAIIGRHEVMDAAQNSFISSAYWTERIGPAAALATIRKHRRENVGEYLIHVGGVLQAGWEAAAANSGLSLKFFGMPPQRGFIFNHERPDVLTTLFTQEMLKRGFLATPRVFATTKHEDREIALYFDAVEEVFAIIAKSIADGDPQRWLDGSVKHSHFERLN